MSRKLYDIAPLVELVEDGFVLLTPNFRLSRRIKSEWDRQQVSAGKQAWEPLPVMPLESWLEQQWRRAVDLDLLPSVVKLGQPLALELWRQVIAQDECDSGAYRLLRPGAAAELAGQARETLLRWQVDLSSSSTRQMFELDTDCGAFLRWHDLFEQRLGAAGQGTTVDCIRQLRGCASQLPPARVALLEFDDIPPLYRDTVTALSEQVREPAPVAEPGLRSLHSFADKRAELQAVARWAHDTSRRAPGDSIGIVLGDMATERVALEYLLRREFGCLGEDYTSLPVNFSTGIALDRAPVVRDGLAALAMAGPRTTLPAVVALLRSRFLLLPDASSPLAVRFISRLFDDGREEVDTADLRYAASQVELGGRKGLALGQVLLRVSGMRELRRAALPSEWVERFSAVLATWGWPGPGPLDSVEFQQVELWHATLDEFRAYDAVCRPLDFQQALQLLRVACGGQVSQPQTSDWNIQVLGPLEAAGLAFDHLWLCGMQATNWPAAASPSPFIPTGLQRRLQMPHATADREWDFAAGLMAQYTRATPALHASYCRQLEDNPELPSALLEGFLEARPVAGETLDAGWVCRWQQRELESLEDNRAPAVEKAELARISGGSGLLEDQSQCPFRAFARRRLAVEPLPAMSLALSAGERGSLLHAALYVLWGNINDHGTLLSLDDASERYVVEQSVEAAIQTVPGRRRRQLGNAYWQLEGQRLATLLREWLEVERLRGEFVVSQREQDVPLALGQLVLSLRVDRIDQLPDGSRVIIDYKSGIGSAQDWLGDRPAKPQLLLYSIAAPGAASALAFAQVRPRESRFVGLGEVGAAAGIRTDIAKVVKDRMDADDWQSLNARWRENLERLAAGFVAGDAQVDPLARDSCTWCGLQPLCRIGAAEAVEETA